MCFRAKKTGVFDRNQYIHIDIMLLIHVLEQYKRNRFCTIMYSVGSTRLTSLLY